ncbi:hypothetical protein [Aequorivita sp. KMM 9714]|uniref:hypothetical protein n=1 Tax=Aequorivita sp. KMM 9714 TaxID=2707173 RepID=UPI0013EDF11D|nr:hypothetical protein [Aequorivita sp. KMM 9714]NGX85384.1 hypothetical protein [Aequorivita sp. KMM 9714]
MKNCLIFLLLITISLPSWSQGPMSPEASSFEPVDATDMVNLLTGDFTYVLPILNVPNPEGGYPITLSYHAGISMEQEASWVGLGWNINPGAISRNVAGVPDDWKNVRSFSSIYNAGGVIESYSGSISVGWAKTFSVGLYGSYQTHKSVNGENSHQFDFGIEGSIYNISGRVGTNGGGIGYNYGAVNVDIGTDGVGIGAGYGGYSIGINQSFIDGSTTISAGGPYGTGMSLNSNGLRVSLLGASVNTRAGRSNMLSQGTNLSWGNGGTLGIITPWFNISYTQSKVKYWLYENEYKENNGSLYPGNLTDLYSTTPVTNRIHFDAYESDINSEKSKITKANFSAPSYDSYIVSGQGIGGSISPHILEQGVMPMGYNTLAERPNNFQQSFMGYFYPTNSQKFNKQISDELLSNQIHFTFDNEITSYIKVKSDNWNTPNSGGTYSDIYNFQPQNRVLDDILVKNGISYNGYNENNGRLRKGNFIETFTNKEIKLNPNLIIEPANFNRSNPEIPEDGIGGYKITTLDGKIYHYSLPVYQKETFSKSTPLGLNQSDSFYENFQLEPYATHWLLTAITGPDYIDVNNNNTLDELDYGYWVSFDYGKWSDGFVWRSPTTGYLNTNRNKSYQWGRKEIYYLDKIVTRTHTALFIKSIRDDNRSAEIDYRNGTNSLEYIDQHLRTFDIGTDGFPYLIGTLHPFKVTAPNTFKGETTSKFFVETHSQRSLKLDKIILLKNNATSANISKSNGNQSNPINLGKIKIEAQAKFFDYSLNHMTWADQFFTVHDVPNWQGEFFGNVLDEGDLINTPQIESEALKTINFSFNYLLAPSSPNSTSPIGGKLALENVTYLAKNNISLIPPYSFKYATPLTPYNNNAVDDWGYPTNDITSWNLNKIKFPTGGEISINYEEDDFHQEAAPSNFVFDSKFEVKFTGSESGAKYVHFRNQSDNLPEENINFYDYFTVGEQSRVNVQFVLDPDHNGGERVADVDKFCMITNLTFDSVTFQIPTTKVQNFERNDIGCFEDNWVFYNWYDDVVSETNGWVREENEGSCSEVPDDSKRVKIQFFSSKVFINQEGGGIRVEDITVSDETGNNFQTTYDYNDPITGNSSGIVSYAPSRMITKDVKHISHIPSPAVMYEYVTVSHNVIGTGYLSKNVYKYNVLKPMSVNGLEFNMGDELSLNISQNQSTNITYKGTAANLKQSKIQLIDKLSNIGRLESIKTYNKKDHLLSENINYYDNYLEQGVIEETFDSYKRIWDYESYSPDIYCLSSSSKIIYPSAIKQVKNINNGYESNTYYNDINFLTGQALETHAFHSDGTEIKSTVIPAYTIPEFSGNVGGYGMGSKVDDITNKNMLSQTAANYTFINKNGWKPIGVGITTWNKEWSYRNLGGLETTPSSPEQKIWRKYQTYIWDGEIDQNGIYMDYNVSNFDGFDWGAESQPEPWKKTSHIERYSHYSLPLEVSDINNNFASTKLGDYDSRAIATSNARYTEMYYSGAEYFYSTGGGYFDGEVSGAHQSEDRSHTGKYSVKLSSGQQGFAVEMKGINPPEIEHRPGKYVISVWANKENYQNARTKIEGTVEPFNGEIIPAGNWVQMNHYFDIPNSTDDIEISLTSASGTVYFDDFRISPLASSVTSYVYNEFDELTFILGSNNIGTKYQYDEAGRLIRIFEETVDTPTISGGFKLSKEYRYNYKNGDGGNGGGDCDFVVEYHDRVEDPDFGESTAKFYFPTTGTLTLKFSVEKQEIEALPVRADFTIRDPQHNIVLQQNLSLNSTEEYVFIDKDLNISIPGEYSVSTQIWNRRSNYGVSRVELLSVLPESMCIGNDNILEDRNMFDDD